MGNKMFLTVHNQRAGLCGATEISLGMEYAAGSNAVEFRHAVELAERERYTQSKSGGNFSTPNGLILQAIKELCPRIVSAEPMQ